MKKMIIALCCIFLCGITLSQSSILSLQQKKGLLDSMISTWGNHHIFNGGIAIREKGKYIYHHCEGFANFEKKIPNSDTTIFNLASVSKPFTAVAVLQLVNKGLLRLSDPFNMYFTDFPYASVTISQLLSHTSGLPEADEFEKPFIASHPDDILTNHQIYNDLVSLHPSPLKAPGERFYYNNLNYILLSLLIEKVSNKTFGDYLQQNIFSKAGMKYSYVRDRLQPNTSRYFRPFYYDTTFYNVDSFTNRKIHTDYPLGGTYGNNNVMTTLGDMILFDKALNNEKLLPAFLLKEMYQPVLLLSGNPSFKMGERGYALGWNVNQKNRAGKFVAWHDGSLVGHTTIFYRDMTDSITYIMYENKESGDFFNCFIAIMDVIENRIPKPVRFLHSVVREAYGPALTSKGSEYAIAVFNTYKSDSAWYVNDDELNNLGYNLLLKSDISNHAELAVEVFRLGTLLFPKSANAYDSYAEGLMQLGKKEEAILMFKKSILLNPNNQSAKDNIKKLTGNNMSQ